MTKAGFRAIREDHNAADLTFLFVCMGLNLLILLFTIILTVIFFLLFYFVLEK